MNGVEIRYGDIAPNAKENFNAVSTDTANVSNLEQLKRYNLSFPNYGNPCELFSVPLDGDTRLFPDDTTDKNIGLWSEQVSGGNGVFGTPIEITLTSDRQYASKGITLTFDRYNNIYCNSLAIEWYRGNTLLYSQSYEPTSAFYFCAGDVKNYNKIVIRFYSLNMPKNRLKLRVIDFGYGTIFYGNELRNVKLSQSINPISSQIEIDTCDFTFVNNTDNNYEFQNKQPLSIYFNGVLRATTFVTKAKRTSRRVWELQSEDYIGLMSTVYFYGDIYDNKNAYELFEEIFQKAKVPYNIDGELENVTVSGLVKYSTCRDALMQVAFATKCVIDTANSDVVNVLFLNDTVTQSIPLSRIKKGQSFAENSTVTSVELTSHSYEKTNEYLAPMWGNDNDGNPVVNAEVGKEYLIIFSQPLYNITLGGGTMIDSSVTHAHFTATSEYVNLRGKKYEETTKTVTKTNPVTLAGDVENVVKIENATLINDNNANDVLNHCYNNLILTKTATSDIIEGRHVITGNLPLFGVSRYGDALYGVSSVGVTRYGAVRYGDAVLGKIMTKTTTYDSTVNAGEIITVESEYMGEITGRVIRQTFTLNGGIIVKETEMQYDNR